MRTPPDRILVFADGLPGPLYAEREPYWTRAGWPGAIIRIPTIRPLTAWECNTSGTPLATRDRGARAQPSPTIRSTAAVVVLHREISRCLRTHQWRALPPRARAVAASRPETGLSRPPSTRRGRAARRPHRRGSRAPAATCPARSPSLLRAAARHARAVVCRKQRRVDRGRIHSDQERRPQKSGRKKISRS